MLFYIKIPCFCKVFQLLSNFQVSNKRGSCFNVKKYCGLTILRVAFFACRWYNSLHEKYGGKRVTGVPRGLQNRCMSHKLIDGFDSHVPPPLVAKYAKLRFRLKPKTAPAPLLLVYQCRPTSLGSPLRNTWVSHFKRASR